MGFKDLIEPNVWQEIDSCIQKIFPILTKKQERIFQILYMEFLRNPGYAVGIKKLFSMEDEIIEDDFNKNDRNAYSYRDRINDRLKDHGVDKCKNGNILIDIECNRRLSIYPNFKGKKENKLRIRVIYKNQNIIDRISKIESDRISRQNNLSSKIDPTLKFKGSDKDHILAFLKEIEEKFKIIGVRIVYFPYTKSISSTLLNETLLRLRNK